MIIRIENLPEGQKIKHINVDISFDESGNVSVQSNIDSGTEAAEMFNSITDMDIEPRDESVDIPEISHEKREQKEIPPEMTDMEF